LGAWFRPRLEILEDRTLPSTFVVTSTYDDGRFGSLRCAMNQANADSDPVSTIDFNISWNDPGHFYYRDDGTPGQLSRANVTPVPSNTASDADLANAALVGAGNTIDPDWAHSWWTIAPSTALPQLTKPVIIDGYSQSGASANTLAGVGALGVAPSESQGDNAVLTIELDGEHVTTTDDGIVRPDTIRGLVINRFESGAAIAGGHGPVQGDFIGTDVSGTLALGNLQGVRWTDIVGGSTPDARNLISGNIYGIIPSVSQIQGNFIGTDITGTKALGNTEGIDIAYDDGNTIIGNLISGNIGFGIGNDRDGTQIQGNFIGTDVTGEHPLGNSKGIFTDGSALIGGTAAGSGNLISGNEGGVDIRAPGILVQGNFIGTDVMGTSTLGNTKGGILFQDAGSNDTVGGIAPGAGNIIAGSGIAINGTSGNMIEGNYIGTNPEGSVLVGGDIAILDGSNNVIGGTAPGAGNVIANCDRGIDIAQEPGGATPENNSIINNNLFNNYEGIRATLAVNTTISGNTISNSQATGVHETGCSGGTISANSISLTSAGQGIQLDATGSTATFNVAVNKNTISSNQSNGIALVDGGNNLIDSNTIENNHRSGVFIGWFVGSSNNVVSNNTIAFNSDRGVDVALASTGNTISTNSIFANGNSGILLEPPANDNQAAPVLTSVAGSAASPTISGSLTSVANSTFRIEFFANPTPGNLANTEGQTLLGSIYVTTDAGGNASFNASGLAALPAGQNYLTATATVATPAGSGYTFGDSSQFSPYLHFVYQFGGFLPPLSNNLAFNQNRTIPIKWRLKDLAGALVTSLSAVTSLQVAPVLSGGGLGTPFNPTPTAGTSLRNDGLQYIFNWDTKGVAVGTYEILLTLADGTLQTKTLQIVTKCGSNGLIVNGTSGTTTTVGGLLGGDITLYVDNTNGDLTADELTRVQDAVTAVDAVTEPYGVKVEEVSDPTLADVTLNMDITSAVGGYADGVLGCTTDAGQITIINGWNFYAGSDATQIGSGQYDFETVVTHELGHALGLGHSTDSTSVMYATLNAGTVNRSLTTADLNVPDSDTSGACGLHAAVVDVGRISNPSSADFGRIGNPSYEDSRDMASAMLAADPSRDANMGLRTLAARDIVFANGLANAPGGQALVLAANFGSRDSSPIFAAQPPRADDDLLFAAPLFPEPQPGWDR
jgi:parallel beta-helix repeat protein